MRALYHRVIALGHIRDAQGVSVEHSGGVSGLARHTEHDLVNIKPVAAGLCVGSFLRFRFAIIVDCIYATSVSSFIHGTVLQSIFFGIFIIVYSLNKRF